MSCAPFLDGEPWVDSVFDASLLPLGPKTVDAAFPEAFFQYVYDLLVPRRPQEGTRRDGWAFALTGAVQYATVLTYHRRGLVFDNRHMSVEFLISCFADGSRVCGSLGADLCAAMKKASEVGLVTFRQFPYVNASHEVDPVSRTILNYYCSDFSFNGACRACDPSLSDYEEVVTSSQSSKVASLFSVSCLPCIQPVSPRYFPVAPFRVTDAAWSADENVSAVKRELHRVGPLVAAVAVEEAALRALVASPRVASLPEGAFYRPKRPDVRGLHAALIVGYKDRFPETRAAADRDAAFWVLRSWWPDLGYSITVDGSRLLVEESTQRSIDRLFNVSMYSDGVLGGVLSFEEIRIQADAGSAPRPVGASDPLVMEARLAGSGSGADVSRFFSWPLLLTFLVLAVLVFWIWASPLRTVD